MKTYIFILLIFFGLGIQTFSNPIMPEALVAEVYFEEGEWYMMIDNMMLDLFGIENFQDIYISCNDGYLNFKDDFLPDFNYYCTLVSNEALLSPVDVNPISDYIAVDWNGGFDFMDLYWSNSPTASVSGPDDGQALVVSYVWGDENYNYTFWLVKATEPCNFWGSCNDRGVFDGYIVDQFEIPIPNAEIRYVSPYLMQASYVFPALITNDSGYFCHNNLFARNYHIYEIVIDDVVYEYDQYISVEPDQTNTYTFLMDFTVIPENPDLSAAYITNYPNPFSSQTTFSISLPAGSNPSDIDLKISDMLGRFVNTIEVDRCNFEDNKVHMKWENDLPLVSGNYIVLLISNGAVLASNNIIIK